MTRILVLRPEPDASITTVKARLSGLEAIAVPLFKIEAIDWIAPSPAGFDGLLLTSANAVRYAGKKLQQLRGLKAYAVGEATAAAAREAGLDIASTGDSGVDRLLGSIEPDLRLLHLCGEQRRQAEHARPQLTPIIVYRSRQIDDPDLSQAKGCVTLVHSPRAAHRFAELVQERSSIAIAAISKAAALPLGEGWRDVRIAQQPSDDALLALAARLCKNRHLK